MSHLRSEQQNLKQIVIIFCCRIAQATVLSDFCVVGVAALALQFFTESISLILCFLLC